MNRTTVAVWPALLAVAALAPAAASANWQRQTTQQLQQTTVNSAQQAEVQRSSLTAVAATGITASAPLIQQGQWNPAVLYTPSVDGGVFSLLLTSQPADPEPPASFDAINSPASGRSASVAPNRLAATVQPDGSLQAGPGASASELKLTITQTYTVFQ